MVGIGRISDFLGYQADQISGFFGTGYLAIYPYSADAGYRILPDIRHTGYPAVFGIGYPIKYPVFGYFRISDKMKS